MGIRRTLVSWDRRTRPKVSLIGAEIEDDVLGTHKFSYAGAGISLGSVLFIRTSALNICRVSVDMVECHGLWFGISSEMSMLTPNAAPDGRSPGW